MVEKNEGHVRTQAVDLVRQYFGPASTIAAVERLAGDASDREYFRLKVAEKGRDRRSAVLMRMSAPLPGNASPDEIPFVNVQRHLERCAVPVPSIFACRPQAGLILLEDCGSVTLQDQLAADDRDRARLYREAIDILLTMQIDGSCAGPHECIALGMRFDTAKFAAELDFLLDHTIRGLLGREMDPADRERIWRLFLEICGRMGEEPLVFTHRDYHSRNLMVQGSGLKVLDFQDARMGLATYDLASLLMDSYVDLGEDFVSEMIAYYLERREALTGETIVSDAFREVLDITAVQRNLKAVGTFGYQAHCLGNEGYVPYIGRTLGYVRKTLARLPVLDGLGELLGKYFGEVW